MSRSRPTPVLFTRMLTIISSDELRSDKCDELHVVGMSGLEGIGRSEPGGTLWRREGKWRGNWRMEWVTSTLTPPPNVIYPALLKLMRTTRLPAVDWTDAPTDLNGLVRFGERRNLVSTRVPSRSARAIRRSSLCNFRHLSFTSCHWNLQQAVAFARAPSVYVYWGIHPCTLLFRIPRTPNMCETSNK